MTLLHRVVPTPLATVALLLLWLALARSVSLGQVLLGFAFSVAIPLMTARLRPRPLRVKKPLVIARFLVVVGYDLFMSNVEVAVSLVAWRWRRPRADFVVIPLELRDPTGLAALAMVTTVIPGTVWSELAADRSAVMLHVWDVPDPEDFIQRFKARYERPLQEIFS